MATIKDVKKQLIKQHYKGNTDYLCGFYDAFIDNNKKGLNFDKSEIYDNLIEFIKKQKRPNFASIQVVVDKMNRAGVSAEPIVKISFAELKNRAKNKGLKVTNKTTKKEILNFLETLEEE